MGKRGRPLKGDGLKKTRWLALRMTEQEWRQVQLAAARVGAPASVWARQVVNRAARMT